MLEATKPNFAEYFPVPKRVDPQRIRRRMGVHFRKIIDHFSSIVSGRLADRKGRFDENDVLDALLNISHDNSEDLEFTHIPHLLLDLFVAGTDTTSNATEWAMAELLRNPDKMKKAQLVVGKGIAVKEDDFPRLPYLQAVVKETFRKHGTTPFIHRRAVSDVEICGFKVPKNSQVLINLWAMGKDPNS